MGEITTNCYVDIPEDRPRGRRPISATPAPSSALTADTCAVITNVDGQSPDIALGTNDEVGGAGDQGMMFGYACDETPELMPHAHQPGPQAGQEADRGAQERRCWITSARTARARSPWSMIDGKPVRVDAVVISSQHSEAVPMEQLRADIMEKVIKATIPAELLDENTKYYINPTGRFVVGGPQGDTGLTGRKIIVDTYGGYARHGGGAFSGKDPSKVDRSAAYADPLGGQEHRGCRPGQAVRGAGGLRHRRGQARLHHGGYLWHRHCGGREDSSRLWKRCLT